MPICELIFARQKLVLNSLQCFYIKLSSILKATNFKQFRKLYCHIRSLSQDFLKSDHKAMPIFVTEIIKALQLIYNSPYINMEELKLEDDNKVSQKSECEKGADDNTGTVKERFVHFLNVMTIEPMMFIQSLGWSITSIAQSQMILFKTCRGKYLVFSI